MPYRIVLGIMLGNLGGGITETGKFQVTVAALRFVHS